VVAGAVLLAVGLAAGFGIGHGHGSGSTTPPGPGGGQSFFGGGEGGQGSQLPTFPGGQGPQGGFNPQGSASGATNSNASDGPTDAAAIARNVDPGIVDITTTIAGGEAAGTGMVLASNGEVLTNNHVITGATSISVRDVGNGQTYKASVVGYDRTHDVAVLQLSGASGLSTVTTATSQPSSGAAVVGIGNAGGTGGTPSYAGGAIIATGTSITAHDEYDGTAHQLTGLLATDAAIQSGDSGGPLVNESGQVVGMDTAATTNYRFSAGDSSTTAHGFAIPIATATAIASQIESGNSSDTVHIGPTAKLGVYVDGSSKVTGAEVAKVEADGPASGAGIVAGDVITSVDGTAVTNSDGLASLMSRLAPGSNVPVGYVTSTGESKTTTVVLDTGAPQ
jgi:S1-C subfamily serine protease